MSHIHARALGGPSATEAPHPTLEQLEGAAYGWLPAVLASAVRAHAARCPRCEALLAAEDELHRRLALLQTARDALPDVRPQVRRHLERAARQGQDGRQSQPSSQRPSQSNSQPEPDQPGPATPVPAGRVPPR